MEIIHVDQFNLNFTIEKSDKNRLFCRKNTEFFNLNDKKICDLTNDHQIIIFLISNENDKEICLFLGKNEKIDDIITTVKNAYFYEDIIGFNNVTQNLKDTIMNFYILGLCNLKLNPFGLDSVNKKYTEIIENNIKNSKVNKNKFLRIYCYNAGHNNLDVFSLENNYLNFIKEKNVNYFDKQCLVVSKFIVGYGGNQKTSLQLIDMLDDEFDVKILSLAISKKRSLYNYKTDKLSSHIHNSQIIKIKNADAIIKHINSSNYEFVINNKLNEYFDLLPKINSNIKQYVITHNSMDPFNELIINNQQYINKSFTINKFHKELMEKYLNTKEIENHTYLNHVELGTKVLKRTQFSKNLVFVGRMSKEKGIHLLISAFIKFIELNNDNANINLLIIGDTNNKESLFESEYYVKHNNIIYLGKLTEHEIKDQLKNCDYLILPSYTEGIPFVILESMSIGIPCIYSKINGAIEIIKNKKSGFLFELEGYDNVKEVINSWKVFEEVGQYFEQNVENLTKCIQDAYSININEWNNMSEECYNFINNNYSKKKAEEINKKLLFGTKNTQNIQYVNN